MQSYDKDKKTNIKKREVSVAKNYLKENPDAQCIFLETAHPVKFLDVVEETLDVKVSIPSQIEFVLDKEKKFHKIKSYEELKAYLNS